MLVTRPSSSYTEPIETGHYLGSEDLGGITWFSEGMEGMSVVSKRA